MKILTEQSILLDGDIIHTRLGLDRYVPIVYHYP